MPDPDTALPLRRVYLHSRQVMALAVQMFVLLPTQWRLTSGAMSGLQHTIGTLLLVMLTTSMLLTFSKACFPPALPPSPRHASHLPSHLLLGMLPTCPPTFSKACFPSRAPPRASNARLLWLLLTSLPIHSHPCRQSHHRPSYPTLSQLIFILSHPILSYPIPSYPIPSPSHPIPSHPTATRPIPSHRIAS